MKLFDTKQYTTALKAAILCLFISSCRKFVEIPPTPSLVESSQVYADSADATSAVLGMYITMINTLNTPEAFSGNVTLYTGMSGDELVPNTGTAQLKSIYTNSIVATNTLISTFWSSYYNMIYQANAVIAGVSGSSSISNSVKNQLLGEARVVRAFTYFNLVNLYGAAPLVTTTNYTVNTPLARSTVDSMYDLIIADLESAQTLLTPGYPSVGQARPNLYTSTALLARVFLYQRLWSKADSAASAVINSGIYTLQQNLNNVFLSTQLNNNTEAIWSLIPTSVGYETPEGCVFVPGTPTSTPKYSINTHLLNAFEPNDLRRTNWIDSVKKSGKSYYYPYKYKLGTDDNSTPLENYMMLRLAEQYLIRAEARAEEGIITGTNGGIADLNVIRERAGLTDYVGATDLPDVLAAIWHEREVELFCEWGHRWYDMRRTGMIDSVMGTDGVCASKNGSWNTDWQLYPLYQSDLNANPYLTQNPGY